MKKILLTLFLLIAIPVFGESIQNNLPSATGLVTSVKYEDITGINQGENAVKEEVTVKVLTGQFKGVERIIDNMLTGNPAYDISLEKGDKVILHVESLSDSVISANDVNFYIADIKRENQISLFVGIFLVLLLVVGRKKGLFSIISIAATLGLICFVAIPMILNGFSPVWAVLISGILSTIITIYLVAGFNAKSSSAILGTSFSLLFASGLSFGAIVLAHLTGFAGEENVFLYSARPDLDFTGILSASIIVAALGALMDTAVSIASTINEIHETDETLSISQLFKSGMNVGRDIIGTMSNTLILVYLGSSLPLLLLSGNIDFNKFFNLNQVATEIISALIGSIAILVCVPVTALVAAYLIKKYKNPKADFDM